MRVSLTMASFLTLCSSAKAFSAAPAFARAAARSTTARAMSSGPPMPFDEDKMPFYALGTNLAMQVGGQGNFKSLLEDDELDVVLNAFCENLKGTAATDARTVLETYGPALNQILQDRSSKLVDRVKADGADFIANFVASNPEAVTTESGMVYCGT
jgi:hypothetical protein